MLLYVQKTGSASAPRRNVGSTTGEMLLGSEMEALGIYGTPYRPVFVRFRDDMYLIGAYTRPLVRDAVDGRWKPAGIRPPQLVLAVVPGSGSGGSSGGCLCYITFLQKVGDRVLAESGPSNVVDVGTLSGEGRAWSNIDTDPEPRATHVRGYVSMNGDSYRMAWEAPVGISTIEENIPTTALSFTGPDVLTGEYGLPPMNVRYGHVWAGRMWYANSPQFPYRLWFSKAGYPQYVATASFRDTPDREPITGIWKTRDFLIVFCRRSSYLVRSFGSGVDDFVMEKLDSNVGCLTHHGIWEIHNKLWFPGESGPWIYDGAFRFVGRDIQPLWDADFEANEAAFLDGFAYEDRRAQCYIFSTARTPAAFENTGLEPGTIAYVGYYGSFEPSIAGDEVETAPDWSLDMKGRKDSSAFYTLPGALAIASCDGKIRLQDRTDGDDDGDTLQKKAFVRPGHWLFGIAGDDKQAGGKTLKQLWAHIESEATAWTLYALGGDEHAWKQVRPDNVRHFGKFTVAASAQSQNVTLSDGTERAIVSVPKTVHFTAVDRVSGRGFTFEVQVVAPVEFYYRGIGGAWGAGPAPRQVMTDDEVVPPP